MIRAKLWIWVWTPILFAAFVTADLIAWVRRELEVRRLRRALRRLS